MRGAPGVRCRRCPRRVVLCAHMRAGGGPHWRREPLGRLAAHHPELEDALRVAGPGGSQVLASVLRVVTHLVLNRARVSVATDPPAAQDCARFTSPAPSAPLTKPESPAWYLFN